MGWRFIFKTKYEHLASWPDENTSWIDYEYCSWQLISDETLGLLNKCREMNSEPRDVSSPINGQGNKNVEPISSNQLSVQHL